MIGITFGTKHSYDDFGLYLADVSVTPPEPWRFEVEVPARNGILDLTPALTSKTRYKNRTIALTFNTVGACNYQQKLTEISNAIHGQRLNVIFDSDPLYHWDAFVIVDQQSSSEALGTFNITLNCYPYKLKNTPTVYTVTGNDTITCVNGRMEVTPEFTATDSVTIIFGDITQTESAGTFVINEIEFIEGNNSIQIQSTGTTTITYTEGEL